MTLISIIPIAAGAYVATNLDNFTLLVTLLARYRSHMLTVALGYLASMLIMMGIAYGIGRAANAISVEYLGLLGIVPISVGVYGIVRLRHDTSTAAFADVTTLAAGQTVFVATLMSQIANGADTIVAISALFADSSPAADVLILVTLVATSIAFVLAAFYAVRHPGFSKWIDRYGALVTPFILSAVGAYILANTVTDLMPA